MKNQRFIPALLLVLIPILAFSQVTTNWNDILNLGISVDEYDRIDLYADLDGIHLIVQETEGLTYYLFDPGGQQIRSSTRDDNVSESPKLNRIVVTCPH
jgi:hypothetical protein